MCGIAGYNLNPSDKIDAPGLARWLLRRIETRGRDAAGAAWSDADGVYYDKAPLTGTVFANRVPLSPLSRNVILHTRWATGGDPKDNRNNHPFALPGITGIHNGVLDHGWQRTFRDLGVKPESETDSESIFALLAHSGLAPQIALSQVRGDASVAWIDSDEPETLHLARLNGRPLAIGQTVGGSLVFASTIELLRQACAAAGVRLDGTENVPEWTYLTVRDGIAGKSRTIPHATPKRPKVTATRGETYWERKDRREALERQKFLNACDNRDLVSPQLRLGV